MCRFFRSGGIYLKQFPEHFFGNNPCPIIPGFFSFVGHRVRIGNHQDIELLSYRLHHHKTSFGRELGPFFFSYTFTRNFAQKLARETNRLALKGFCLPFRNNSLPFNPWSAIAPFIYAKAGYLRR